MAKKKKRGAEQTQNQTAGDECERLKHSVWEKAGWTEAQVQAWRKKQNDIPIRINQYPKPTKTTSASAPIQNGWLIYAPNFDRQKLAFEKSIRQKTIQFLEDKFPPGFDKADWNDQAVVALLDEFRTTLAELDFLLTAGNQKAAAALGILAGAVTKQLIEISESHAPALKEIAQHSNNWPVLKARKGFLNAGHQFVEILNVGGAVPFSEEAMAMLPKAQHKDAMRLAMDLLCRLDYWRQRDDGTISWTKPNIPPTKAEASAGTLPVLTKASWRKWFDLAWEVLMEEHNNHPEEDPVLRRMGEHRKSHTELTSQPRQGQVFKTPKANIRDGIKSRLKKTVEELATRSIVQHGKPGSIS